MNGPRTRAELHLRLAARIQRPPVPELLTITKLAQLAQDRQHIYSVSQDESSFRIFDNDQLATEFGDNRFATYREAEKVLVDAMEGDAS
jgi:hypothetical protein